jgi:hypothetical protein
MGAAQQSSNKLQRLGGLACSEIRQTIPELRKLPYLLPMRRLLSNPKLPASQQNTHYAEFPDNGVGPVISDLPAAGWAKIGWEQWGVWGSLRKP